MIDKESLWNIMMFNDLQAEFYGGVNEMFVHAAVLWRL